MEDNLENEIEEEESDLETPEDENSEDEESEEKDDSTKEPKELWLEDEGEDDQTSPDIPLSTHIRMRKKLKGRLSDKDDEIETVKAENVKLKASMQQTTDKLPKRPKEDDFATPEEYWAEVELYEDDMAIRRHNRITTQQSVESTQKAAEEHVQTSVEEHYNRADDLMEEHKIDPEVFQATDRAVRKAVDAVKPGFGDRIVDQMISILGPGSEKVMFYTGKNDNIVSTFTSLLSDDPSGLKAAAYLGRQQERLLNNTKTKRTSKAPAPASEAPGDTAVNTKEGTFKKKYLAAHKKGNSQEAYRIRKQARVAKMDVSNW